MDIEIDNNQSTNQSTKEGWLKKKWRTKGAFLMPIIIGIDITTTNLSQGLPIVKALSVALVFAIPFALMVWILQKSKNSWFCPPVHQANTFWAFLALGFLVRSLESSGAIVTTGSKILAFLILFTSILKNKNILKYHPRNRINYLLGVFSLGFLVTSKLGSLEVNLMPDGFGLFNSEIIASFIFFDLVVVFYQYLQPRLFKKNK